MRISEKIKKRERERAHAVRHSNSSGNYYCLTQGRQAGFLCARAYTLVYRCISTHTHNMIVHTRVYGRLCSRRAVWPKILFLPLLSLYSLYYILSVTSPMRFNTRRTIITVIKFDISPVCISNAHVTLEKKPRQRLPVGPIYNPYIFVAYSRCSALRTEPRSITNGLRHTRAPGTH